MVLSTEWSQVEVIDLVNDGSGLGFGIVGGRSTGVVVKSILPGGIADRDGRLQSGDHILQIGDVHTRGLGSEHVATVLRQSGAQVRIVVARPVEPTSSDYRALGSHAPIVPTKALTDPEELEALLLQNGYPESFDPTTPLQEVYEQFEQGDVELTSSLVNIVGNPYPIQVIAKALRRPSTLNNPILNVARPQSTSHISSPVSEESPESEHVVVHLEKNVYGLGITVAGYVWEREDLSGIFVKDISEGSAADLSHQIHLNDRIVEVDGHSLRGVTNHEAVEMLRHTGKSVKLSLERYLRGPRYEHLQNALQAENIRPNISPPSPSVTTLSWFPVQTDGENVSEIEPEAESHTTIDSTIFEPPDPDTVEVFVDTHFESGSVTPDLDEAVKRKWETIVGRDTEIVVAQLRKLRGLGISLEGTVDVEDGIELRPRHYIRSILPEGPVGRNGRLSSGDELLEVNGQKLLGRNHVDVVKILKELPETVRMVCARNNEDVFRIIDTAQDREAFAARSILGGSLRTLLNAPEKEFGKVQSDGSLNTSSTATLADETDALNDSLKTDAFNSEVCDSLNKVLFCESECSLDTEVRNGDEVVNENICAEDIDVDVMVANNSLVSINVSTMEDVSEETSFSETPSNELVSKCDQRLIRNGSSVLETHVEQSECSDDVENIPPNSNIDELVCDKDGCEEVPKTCCAMNADVNGLSVETNKVVPNGVEGENVNMERRKSRSLEAVTYLAIWKTDVEVIELCKSNKGLGFSILDYQDPLDPEGTVIVVRSLMPKGSAEVDGRLRPGDRIMSVNETSLRNVSLEAAVKALKGTPMGKVRIGFSKPMPLTRKGDAGSPISISDDYFIW